MASSARFSLILSTITLTVVTFLLQTCTSQKPLAADDVYTFCSSGRSSDATACMGYCSEKDTSCSPETGVCSCSTTKTISSASSNYNCKPAAVRTRCSNACKTFAAIQSFRKGDPRICTSKSDNRKMCFCMPRIK